VSRCYLDTNFLYAHLRSPPTEAEAQVADAHSTSEQAPPAAVPRTTGSSVTDSVASWRTRVLAEVTIDGGVIGALVFDELAYRLTLAWLRDDGERDPLARFRADTGVVMRAMRARLAQIWQSLDSLSLELQPTDNAVVEQAKSLMADPCLAPRDAFHGAHALLAGCEAIASADPAFDELVGIRRISP
jgi:predicted nucleic acid-binding protein